MSSQPEGSQPRSDAVGWWATPGVGRPAVDIAESTRAVLEAFDCGADLRPLGSQLVGLREVIDQLEAVFVRGAAEFDRRDVPPERRAEAEQALQQPAKTLDPMLLKRVGQELLHQLEVERAEQAAVRRLERRGLDLAETLGGMVSVSGVLDPVSGATVLTAIDSLVSPTRGDDSDERTWSQRRADALTEICRRHLDSGEAPVSGGVRPHLSIVVDLATLQQRPGCGPAELAWVGPITAEQARLQACDAVVSRVVVDGTSQVLDVGRVTRTIPPALRRAVTVRDGGCVAPGCHTQPVHCEVHHVVFWEDGGSTSLDNCVMLCRRHHGFVHARGWSVVLTPGGVWTLAPPGGPAPPGSA